MEYRIYIGAGRAQEIPRAVLAHSIHSRARPQALGDELSICTIFDQPPQPKDKRNRGRTPFSFQRFMIPKDCAYRGRAVYLDSDMLCFDDIVQLFDMDMGGAAVLSTDVAPEARNAVLLIDCEKARWDVRDIVRSLDRGEIAYKDLMEDLRGLGEVRRTIPSRWNRLDEYHPGDTAILHYTDMQRQPWRFPRHPLERFWLDHLRAAYEAQMISPSRIAAAEKGGHIRSGLIDAALAVSS